MPAETRHQSRTASEWACWAMALGAVLEGAARVRAETDAIMTEDRAWIDVSDQSGEVVREALERHAGERLAWIRIEGERGAVELRARPHAGGQRTPALRLDTDPATAERARRAHASVPPRTPPAAGEAPPSRAREIGLGTWATLALTGGFVLALAAEWGETVAWTLAAVTLATGLATTVLRMGEYRRALEREEGIVIARTTQGPAPQSQWRREGKKTAENATPRQKSPAGTSTRVTRRPSRMFAWGSVLGMSALASTGGAHATDTAGHRSRWETSSGAASKISTPHAPNPKSFHCFTSASHVGIF